MLSPCLFTWHKKSYKLMMAISTLPWMLFLYTEATTPITSNIRVDLAILGPIYLLSFIAWFAIFITGVLHRKSQPKNQEAQAEPHLKIKRQGIDIVDKQLGSAIVENESDKQALEAFIKSLVILAETRDYDSVAAPFSGFKNIEAENEGATFIVPGKKIYNAIIHVERDQEPPYASRPIVANLGLLFESNAVHLSDIQNIFGGWYRDPADGVVASFAGAYFNPRMIAPTADYFLYVSTTEGNIDKLNSNSPIEMIGACWHDNRYDKENRPW